MPLSALELLTELCVGLTVLPPTFKKAFSGTGVSRRRDEVITKEVAKLLGAHIGRVHHFYAEDQQIAQEEIVDFLFDQLKSVPDALAKAFTAKDRNMASQARDEIAERLCSALLDIWSVKYEPVDWDKAASGKVRWHRSDDEL